MHVYPHLVDRTVRPIFPVCVEVVDEFERVENYLEGGSGWEIEVGKRDFAAGVRGSGR